MHIRTDLFCSQGNTFVPAVSGEGAWGANNGGAFDSVPATIAVDREAGVRHPELLFVITGIQLHSLQAACVACGPNLTLSGGPVPIHSRSCMTADCLEPHGCMPGCPDLDCNIWAEHMSLVSVLAHKLHGCTKCS